VTFWSVQTRGQQDKNESRLLVLAGNCYKRHSPVFADGRFWREYQADMAFAAAGKHYWTGCDEV